MHGLNATRAEKPVTYAVLSTTRDWVDDFTLREGWAQFARKVRREVVPDAGYAWFREWTTGRYDGVRRTHYHSTWNAIADDDQARAVAEISNDVWGRLAGAWNEHAHGCKRIWDAGGLARYVAGLAAHHLKQGQEPPPGWDGRRVGTSRGFYALDARELRAQAETAVREQRIAHHLTTAMLDGAHAYDVTQDAYDELLTTHLELARSLPKPRIVKLPKGWQW